MRKSISPHSLHVRPKQMKAERRRRLSRWYMSRHKQRQKAQNDVSVVCAKPKQRKKGIQ